ncbi:hypothetical protein DBR41_28610 [Pseudomonas sp. HMWF010]|nr:hypothetical protein DBR21_01235 [Caulobacter sp. HMWF009]PTT10666.1 hypothetical protein DBR10_05165 [Caulobacter sp. HMWF025]PTT73042.1 hypothetical protein DBR41_28610 [Pseudomonas sp. HMWF010]
MVRLPPERSTPHRTCGRRMGPAPKARDDGACIVAYPSPSDAAWVCTGLFSSALPGESRGPDSA